MTDSFLFLAIVRVSWVKISILCILLNPIVYARSFQLHFHFNKTQMNTIVPDLKVLYCLKNSRVGSVHSGNIGRVSDQFISRPAFSWGRTEHTVRNIDTTTALFRANLSLYRDLYMVVPASLLKIVTSYYPHHAKLQTSLTFALQRA